MLVLVTLTVLIFIIVLTFIVLKVCLIPQLKEGLRVMPRLEFRGRRDIGSCEVVNFLRIAS